MNEEPPGANGSARGDPRRRHDRLRRARIRRHHDGRRRRGCACVQTDAVQHFGDKVGLFVAVIEANIADAETGTDPHLAALRETTDVDADLLRFARQHLRGVLQPHLMRIRRLVIAEADRFPTLAQTWFERGPERAHAVLETVFHELTRRGILDIDRPRLAAQHFNWLVLSIPLHRSLYLSTDQPTDREIDEIASDAVRIFLAAHRAT